VALLTAECTQSGGYEGAAQVAEVKLFQDGDGAREGTHRRGGPHLPHPARVGPGQEPLQALRVGRDARANAGLRQGREVPRQPGHDRPVGQPSLVGTGRHRDLQGKSQKVPCCRRVMHIVEGWETIKEDAKPTWCV
jgi:hypothetical protein